jgi:hypothetical protein
MARYSLKWLLGTVAVIALWAAAVANANAWWVAFASIFNAVALMYASLRIAFAGRRAPFWVGFALVGWVWIATPLRESIPVAAGRFYVAKSIVGLPTATGIPVAINFPDPRARRLQPTDQVLSSILLLLIRVGGGVAATVIASTERDS